MSCHADPAAAAVDHDQPETTTIQTFLRSSSASSCPSPAPADYPHTHHPSTTEDPSLDPFLFVGPLAHAPRSFYISQTLHHLNELPNSGFGFRHCPPAGSTAYPVPVDVTLRHWAYSLPPLAQPNCQRPPRYVNFADLVGDPGVKDGIQIRPFNDPLEPDEFRWSRPCELNNGIPTWEAHETAWLDRPVNTSVHTQSHSAPPEHEPAPSGVDSVQKNTPAEVIPEDDSDLPDKSDQDDDNDDNDYFEPVKPLNRGAGRRKTKLPEKFKQSLSQTKRVKNKRVERPFIIGSEAWPLDETGTRKAETPAEHTKGWRVYVKVPPGQPEITTWLKKVSFKIFHTYANPTRTIEDPPFQIEETGWGGFNVEVKLTFVPEVNARSQDRSHFLQLEPYGDEAEQEKQKREKLVRSEFLDYIEFNEPTEPMFDILTSDDQFKGGAAKSGKGKGKGKKLKREDDEDASDTVQLPESSSAANPYSKELEHQLLDILRKAEGQVDELLKTDASKAKAIEEQLKELRPAET